MAIYDTYSNERIELSAVFNEIAVKYDANTTGIKKKIYPLVEDSLKNSSRLSAYKRVVNDFISYRTEDLYDSLPCARLVCSELEMDRTFDALKISKSFIADVILNDTYYGRIEHFSPLAAKHEFTILMMNVIRYFASKNMKKECELALIHLAFSGKFYPSLHYRSYHIVPARHVMEYVVNNELSKKFDLTVQGSVIGAVKSVCSTWLDTYKDKFKSFTDDDIKYLIDQLYSRIGSFVKNIASEYYKVYENKDTYFAYYSDSNDPEDFHIADNDSFKVSRYTERAINYINTNGIDYRICKACSNGDITPNECKAVIESIISTRENIPEIKELISLMISLYFSSESGDISDIKFITYTISPKPNAKQKEIVRLKEIIEEWLCESGTAYMRRRSRAATKNAYERAVRMYFALTIHNANRQNTSRYRS